MRVKVEVMNGKSETCIGQSFPLVPRKVRYSRFRFQSNQQGFSLMELLVVVAVIGILMGISFPAIQGAIDRARVTRARSEISSLQQAWLAYWNTYYDPVTGQQPEFWPGSTEMTAATVAILAGEDTDANPQGIAFMEFDDIHLNEGFLDPWGNPYQIEFQETADFSSEWTYETRVFLGNTARGKY